MKKALSILLLLSLALAAIPALADENLQRFQPYTNVDLSVFDSAGFSCNYDKWGFTAELSPASNMITWKAVDPDYSSFYDDCSITMDIKVVYAAGSATLVPRFIIHRSGVNAYFDSRMDEIFIKNGENRYRIDATGVSRSTDSKSYTATESVVEPFYLSGCIMLADLANSSDDISVCINRVDEYTLTDADKSIIKNFYDTCEKAGIFNQDFINSRIDNAHIITLFNEGSVGTEEANTEELEPAADEEPAA